MGEIGNMIYRRRLELGLTLEDVARAVGVGKSTVRKWENGMIRNMGRDKIAALAAVLQLSPVDFVPVGDPAPEPISKINLDRLEALHQNPRLCQLFDKSRKMTEKDVDFMIQMADRILGERDGNE